MRRVFRRQIRKSLAQDVPPILQEANFAFSKGEYGRAAELFEQIARIADGRNGPRAPLFHLQAGRARLLAGQSGLSLPSLKRGLELLSQRGQFQRLHRFGSRTVEELSQRGLNDEAGEISVWLKTVLIEVPAAEKFTHEPALPTHCPACGAPLRHDEVEWQENASAQCGYCGSPVRNER